MMQCEQCKTQLEEGWQWPLCGDCLTGVNCVAVECKCGHAFEILAEKAGRIAQCPECMRTVPVPQQNASEQPEDTPTKALGAEEKYQRDYSFRCLVDVLEQCYASDFEQAMALAIQHHKERRELGTDGELPDNAHATGDVTAAILR